MASSGFQQLRRSERPRVDGLPPVEIPQALYDPFRRHPGDDRDSPSATTYPPSGRAHFIPKTSRGFSKLADSDDYKPSFSKGSTWDVVSEEEDYEKGDARSSLHSPYISAADGDAPNNKFAELYHYLLNASVVTRRFIFIVPALVVIWIPGILGRTALPNARIWGVPLLWWSAWLTVAWVGWWASIAFAFILPRIARYTIGVVPVDSRMYISWLSALQRYIALTIWALVTWISWVSLIIINQDPAHIYTGISLMARLLFGILLSVGILLGEKLAIRVIETRFHERSYSDRVEDQKKAIHILVVLYQHSSDATGRPDPLKLELRNKAIRDANRAFKLASQGAKKVARTTTSAFGDLSGEITGEPVLPPNSPQAAVLAALETAKNSRLLAQRLFYSFVQPGEKALYPTDIEKFFPSRDEANDAFFLFDRDGNGDATLAEIELACMDCHHEQLSIANSVKDLNSAVKRLDNIFMSLYSVIVILILAVVLDSQFTAVLAGLGTVILGLSWLVGGSLAEVLSSIIFLFIKHPYDVGDRVVIDDVGYTVKEIELLTTTLIDKNNTSVQAPHQILCNKLISNIRRSPTMSETFAFDVAFDTTFEQIEALRDKMIAFLIKEHRDFKPIFDVVVADIPEQQKMSLTADIRYKSNWQQGALKALRRNKWICALKQCLSELKIYGPNGAGNPGPVCPSKYTQVPWEEAKRMGKVAQTATFAAAAAVEPTIDVNYRFNTDKNAVLFDSSQDVFGETDQPAVPS